MRTVFPSAIELYGITACHAEDFPNIFRNRNLALCHDFGVIHKLCVANIVVHLLTDMKSRDFPTLIIHKESSKGALPSTTPFVEAPHHLADPSALHLCHRVKGCTDILIEINPRHRAFYERLLGSTGARYGGFGGLNDVFKGVFWLARGC